MPTTPKQVLDNREHYDNITDAWRLIFGDNFHWGLFLSEADDLEAATSNLIDAMADLSASMKGARVLDVGCGIGGPAIHLVEKYHCHVTGISVSSVGIDRARENASKRDLGESLNFELGDAMQMGFEDETFDVAWVMESSHLMPDKPRLISECLRVLKPGGSILLCDLMLTRQLSPRELLRNEQKTTCNL